MERKKKEMVRQQLNDVQPNVTPKRSSARKRSTIKYKESDSEEEVFPKKSRLSKDSKSSGKSPKKKIQEPKSVCKNSSPKIDESGTPMKKVRKGEVSNVKKQASTPKPHKTSVADDETPDEDEDAVSDYENVDHSDSESENDQMDENDGILSKNLMINENAFKEQMENACKSDNSLLLKEINFLAYHNGDEDNFEMLLDIMKEQSPKFIKSVNEILNKMNKMHLSQLNNKSQIYGVSLVQVFAYCLKTFKNDYNYNDFFENVNFDQLITRYFKYISYERKLQRAKCVVSSDGKTVVTKELSIGSIKVTCNILFNWLRMFQCKISKDTIELFKSLPSVHDDIKAKRGREDVEEIKWPLTLFDLNWYFEHHAINDKKSLMAAALISFMTHLGVRTKTVSKMLLKDMMVYQNGRKLSHITFTLTWLKECNDTKKVFLPGDLKPVDAAGLLIKYLDTRKVFEAGLDQSEPSYVIKSDCQNEPLFLFSNADVNNEIINVYKELAKTMNAPKYAISPRSSRKGHCIQHLLNTKSIYPAMPLELLEEDLVSLGTWSMKRSMRHYLKGGCNQVLITCNRIENLETSPPSFDAHEYHLFLVDALQIISDWKVTPNDPSVKDMEKKMFDYGAKQNKGLTEYCQELVSSINFYKKVKALELDLNNLPKIAIKVLPKAVNLEHGYCEGEEVFLKSRPICETCNSFCIREKPAIKNFNAFSFMADKKFYLNMKGLDDNDFENKMAEQFTNDANQHKCLLNMFHAWSLEK